MKIDELDITISDDRWQGCEDVVQTAVNKALGTWQQDLGEQSVELSVLLTTNEQVQDLNREYREKDKPTNVLSFPALDCEEPGVLILEPGPIHLGDIILAYDVLVSETLEQDISMNDHLTHLIIHGCLHLLGYDHIDDEEAEEMESLEIDLLSQLGIANPYETGAK